jgi:hypothetical protein
VAGQSVSEIYPHSYDGSIINDAAMRYLGLFNLFPIDEEHLSDNDYYEGNYMDINNNSLSDDVTLFNASHPAPKGKTHHILLTCSLLTPPEIVQPGLRILPMEASLETNTTCSSLRSQSDTPDKQITVASKTVTKGITLPPLMRSPSKKSEPSKKKTAG